MKLRTQDFLIRVIIIMTITHLSAAQESKAYPSKLDQIFSEEQTFHLDDDQESYIFPIDLLHINQETYSKSVDRQNDSTKLFLFQIQIFSQNEYQVYLNQKGNSQSILQFNNLNGYHHLKLTINKSTPLSIILQRVNPSSEQISSNEGEEEDDDDINNDNENDNKKNNNQMNKNEDEYESYSIEIFELKQNKCAFDCHGRGVCRENGRCECNNGYSVQYNCQIKLEYVVVEIDELVSVKASQQTLKNKEEEWVYTGIQLNDIEEINIEILSRREYNQGLNEVAITFFFDKEDIENLQLQESSSNEHIISVFNSKNYFNCLQIEQSYKENILQTTFYFDRSQYNRLLSNPQFNGQLGIFKWNKNIRQLSFRVEIFFDTYNILYEILLITFAIFSSILILIILSFFFLSKKNTYYIKRKFGILPYTLNTSSSSIHIPSQSSSQISQTQYTSQSQNENSQTNQNECMQELNIMNQECSICLCTYQETDVLCITKCRHIFHKNCLDQWLSEHFVCPLDRINLLEQ